MFLPRVLCAFDARDVALRGLRLDAGRDLLHGIAEILDGADVVAVALYERKLAALEALEKSLLTRPSPASSSRA